ncbi:14240_t:CDS:2 [Ambispora leptoticha]|uniref:14240_t:CDS:1 n=1 Tax=Ambispora leptoticha TaxID=144679 RepID=A0A9N9DWU3_9GLOM|nr:14240_t:CDS:2 [Ambispora leptoticha]
MKNNNAFIDTDSNESTPLLKKTPWYRRPSSYWLLVAFFVIALTYGFGLVIRVQLYIKIVCKLYYESENKSDLKADYSYLSSFTSLLSSSSTNNIIFNGGESPNLNCNIPQSEIRLNIVSSRLNYILHLNIAIFVLGALGSLSDRKGRRISLLLATTGICFNVTVLIVIAEYVEYINPIFLAVGSLVEGLTGGLLSFFAISQAYITDCTIPSRRSVMFGWLHGATLLGVSVGPLMGGWIVSVTNNLLSVFYVSVIIFMAIFLFILLILPESLSSEKLESNAQLRLSKNEQRQSSLSLKRLREQVYIIFEPLSIILPKSFNSTENKEDGEKNKKMTFLLANIIAMIAASNFGIQAIFVLYTNYKFDWSALDQGYFIFWSCASRALILFFGLPLLVKCFRKYRGDMKDNIKGKGRLTQQLILSTSSANDVSSQKMLLDIWIIRVGLIIESLTFVAYGTVTVGSSFTLATLIGSLGTISIPTAKSLLTNTVPASQTGQLLGALSVIESVMRLVSPVIMSTLYSLLVANAPHVIWFVLAGFLAVGATLSFFIVFEDEVN